jgi:DNA-binding MarR family transcriptional regulator
VTSLTQVFAIAAAVAALGFLLTLWVSEQPLRGMVPGAGSAQSLAMMRDATSLEELERIVAALLARENRWRVYADLAQRAELDLSAPELWLLARLGEREPLSANALAAELKVPMSALQQPLSALCRRGIVEDDNAQHLRLTPVGLEMRDRLRATRSKGLADLLARWEPERHPDVLALVNRLVDTLTRDLPTPGAVEKHAATRA